MDTINVLSGMEEKKRGDTYVHLDMYVEYGIRLDPLSRSIPSGHEEIAWRIG